MSDGRDEVPQVLRVKKGARVLDEGPLSGDFPASLAGAPSGPARGRPRKPGRLGRLSTVAALILAGLALVIALRAQPREAGRVTLAGYQAELRAAAAPGWVTASVSLARTPGEPARGPTRARVRFSVPETGQEAYAEQDLAAVGILSARLPLAGTEKRLLARLTIGREERDLSVRLRVPGKP